MYNFYILKVDSFLKNFLYTCDLSAEFCVVMKHSFQQGVNKEYKINYKINTRRIIVLEQLEVFPPLCFLLWIVIFLNKLCKKIIIPDICCTINWENYKTIKWYMILKRFFFISNHFLWIPCGKYRKHLLSYFFDFFLTYSEQYWASEYSYDFFVW